VMVGADDLARAAGALREAVEKGERDAVGELMAEVDAAAERTRHSLVASPGGAQRATPV
jgi:hypothetical protein